MNSYNDLTYMEQLLRRLEALEVKVTDLQRRNEKLEETIRGSFIGFKFNSDTIDPTITNGEQQRLNIINNYPGTHVRRDNRISSRLWTK